MNSIWQMWKGELSETEISEIINECEYYEVQKAQVANQNSTINPDIRRSQVRWIDSADPNSKFIYDIVWKYARAANKIAFGFDIHSLTDIQYTIYDGEEEGFYDWHYDTFWGNPTFHDRKLSVTIQLSDSKDYEGGDFKFDPQYEAPAAADIRMKGTVLVFASPIKHKVEPVTKGIRRSLVAWVEGPKWK